MVNHVLGGRGMQTHPPRSTLRRSTGVVSCHLESRDTKTPVPRGLETLLLPHSILSHATKGRQAPHAALECDRHPASRCSCSARPTIFRLSSWGGAQEQFLSLEVQRRESPGFPGPGRTSSRLSDVRSCDRGCQVIIQHATLRCSPSGPPLVLREADHLLGLSPCLRVSPLRRRSSLPRQVVGDRLQFLGREGRVDRTGDLHV